MGRRVALVPVLLGLVALVFWLQSHIWFFTVSGNETVPTEKILWVLEENGVHFWTRTAALDMNTLKNQVLSDLPELSWITINTQGGLAEVVVRERSEKPVTLREVAPANVVAKKSGVVTRLEITGGTAQVQTGDIVAQGELLISGITNLDKTMLLTRAVGEVYATTWNHFSVILPDIVQEKVYTGRETTRYRLNIGKKTINFYKTSGISYGKYDKIVESTKAALPGGYTFPLTFTKITYREYQTSDVTVPQETAAEWLAAARDRALQLSMTAGRILETSDTLTQEAGAYHLTGVAECQEEIGTAVEIKE
jgi:similar to stage IV sporulation protein